MRGRVPSTPNVHERGGGDDVDNWAATVIQRSVKSYHSRTVSRAMRKAKREEVERFARIGAF